MKQLWRCYDSSENPRHFSKGGSNPSPLMDHGEVALDQGNVTLGKLLEN